MNNYRLPRPTGVIPEDLPDFFKKMLVFDKQLQHFFDTYLEYNVHHCRGDEKQNFFNIGIYDNKLVDKKRFLNHFKKNFSKNKNESVGTYKLFERFYIDAPSRTLAYKMFETLGEARLLKRDVVVNLIRGKENKLPGFAVKPFPHDFIFDFYYRWNKHVGHNNTKFEDRFLTFLRHTGTINGLVLSKQTFSEFVECCFRVGPELTTNINSLYDFFGLKNLDLQTRTEFFSILLSELKLDDSLMTALLKLGKSKKIKGFSFLTT
jgi:hypothetical protein